jgi:DNA-directed RNA polymerase subunit RPC12/RpoP
MTVSFACPRCEQPVTEPLPRGATSLTCPRCGLVISIPPDAFDQGKLKRCLVCPSRDLYVRKDFPQRLGVGIVVAGFFASSIAWYYYQIVLTFAILFATALADLLLYVLVGGVLVCYRCQAHYRGIQPADDQGAFHLETHERYRQQAARLGNQAAEKQPLGR